MKKKGIILLGAALVAVAAIAYVGMRLARRGTDLIGVTTLAKKNTVILNAKTGEEFVSGSGKLTVAEGEGIHLEYALDSGSVDFAVNRGSNGLAVFESADLANLPAAGEVFGKSGISGSGSLDLAAAPGEYTLYFRTHDAVGTAKATASK